ncbi:MAG: hypothetical protein KDE19_23580 [Caldilineaceae bacterium]|nr:hypothetical protein [Caldilineaceae bacterium]
MSNTGGGHRASAEALRAGFVEMYGDRVQVDVIDLLMEHLPWPLNWLPHTYTFLIQDTAWLWKLLWQTSKHPFTIRRLSMLVARWGESDVIDVFEEYYPDLIISVHPLVQEFSLRALRRMGRRISFVTVVTDLATAHPLWFHPAVDACYVASKEAYQRARRMGLRPGQLHLYGLPIHPVFARPLSSQVVLRAQLGLDETLPAVLITSGGEGVGPIREIAEQLNTQLVDNGRVLGQMIIICGRNASLQRQLAAQSWAIPVTIQGFVNNMHEWMAASDCIVTKAGPGTIAEALTSGLPIILNGFIPGQEEGNVPYVLDNHVGVYHKTPAAIAATIRRWFGEDGSEFEQIQIAARSLGRPQATLQIVESIGDFLSLNAYQATAA